MANLDLIELANVYAAIVLRQETGMDAVGDKVDRYQSGDSARMLEIEQAFRDADDHTLEQYVAAALDDAYEASPLPHSPDRQAVEKILIEMQQEFLEGNNVYHQNH